MRKRDGILAAVAFAALVIYALACKPAWSPSGKLLAFPYKDGGTGGIALYEVATGKVRRLRAEAGESLATAQCLWTSDGKSLLAAAGEQGEAKGLRILKIDPATGKAEKVAAVKGMGEAMVMFPPVLAADRWLWLSGLGREEGEKKEGAKKETFCARVDLTNGKVEEFFKAEEEGTCIYDFGKRGVFYLQPKDKKIELGKLDPETGKQQALATFAEADAKTMSGFLAAEPEGRRFAMVTGGEGDDRPASLRVFDDRGKTVKDIPLPREIKGGGYLTWAGDGVWIAVERKAQEVGKTAADVGLLRVEVATGKTRFIVLLGGKAAKDQEAASFCLQPSVSPDGKRLAVAAPMFAQPEAALFIFDLTAPEQAPVKVALPPAEAGGKGPAPAAPAEPAAE